MDRYINAFCGYVTVACVVLAIIHAICVRAYE